MSSPLHTICLVDLDGVVADLEAALVDRVDELTGGRWRIEPADRTGFAIADNYLERYGRRAQQLVWDVMGADGFYRNLPIIDGAVAGVAALEDAGWNVVFCTAPKLGSGTCATDKFEWMAEVFGRRLARRSMVAKDKTVAAGAVLVDDKPQVTGVAAPLWRHLLFDAPGNRDTAHPWRATGWDGVVAELGEGPASIDTPMASLTGPTTQAGAA